MLLRSSATSSNVLAVVVEYRLVAQGYPLIDGE